MTSLFTATAANLAVLDFALSCANVLTAIAGVLLTFSGLAGTTVKLTPDPHVRRRRGLHRGRGVEPGRPGAAGPDR